jgi:hypothetical protein
MLFDLTFPCYLTTFSGKKCLSKKVICVFFVPLIEVLMYLFIYLISWLVGWLVDYLFNYVSDIYYLYV